MDLKTFEKGDFFLRSLREQIDLKHPLVRLAIDPPHMRASFALSTRPGGSGHERAVNDGIGICLAARRLTVVVRLAPR